MADQQSTVDNQNDILAQVATDIGDLREQISGISSDGSTAVVTPFFEDADQGVNSLNYINGASVISVETENNVGMFYRLVRDFIARIKPWSTNVIRYQTKPDERYDATLVAKRIYGSREEYIAVVAAADMDSVENELKQQQLILPTLSQLESLKRQAGYKSKNYNRING